MKEKEHKDKIRQENFFRSDFTDKHILTDCVVNAEKCSGLKL